MSRETQSVIVAAEAGWRQIRTKVEGNQRIFKVEQVLAWAVCGGKASPLSAEENAEDFHLVELVSPLCEDSEEVLLRRAYARLLH